MCYNRKTNFEKGYMDFDLYKKIIDEGEKYNLDSIKLSWRGEPLLHPKIVDMVRYAKQHKITEVSFNTNAELLNDKLSSDLIDSGLDRIMFSVDGVSRKTFETIRVGGNYDKVIKNINDFIRIKKEKNKTKPFTRIQFIKMEENKHEEVEFFNKWEGIIDEVYTSPSLPMKINDDIIREFKIKGRKPCAQLWRRLFISWDGKVSACCIDWNTAINLGNANQDSIYSIWHGNEIQNMRKNHCQLKMENLCRNCCNFDSYIL
jgi:MoaA/NifB/PqqE/SkfB family radical SAM enzyme